MSAEAGAGTSRSGIDPRILKEAAQWLTRFQSNDIDDRARREWAHWKNASVDHARAWEKAERLLGMIRTVPPELSAPLSRPSRINRRQALKAVVAAAFVGPASWGGYRYLEQGAGWPVDTAIGQSKTFTLADGVTVALNTDSAVKLLQDPDGPRIHLLHGELLLDVPAAARMLHTVSTADGWVRMTDGRVNMRRSADSSELTLVAGAARLVLTGAGTGTQIDALEVKPTQQVLFTRDRVVRVRQGERVVEAATAWRNGVIYADDMPLGDFLEEVARYRPGYLICDPAVADLRISGAFHSGDTDRILATVQNTLPVVVTIRTRYWVTVQAPGRATTST